MKPSSRKVIFVPQEKIVPCDSEADYQRIVEKYKEQNILRCDFEPNTFYGSVMVQTVRVVYAEK